MTAQARRPRSGLIRQFPFIVVSCRAIIFQPLSVVRIFGSNCQHGVTLACLEDGERRLKALLSIRACESPGHPDRGLLPDNRLTGPEQGNQICTSANILLPALPVSRLQLALRLRLRRRKPRLACAGTVSSESGAIAGATVKVTPRTFGHDVEHHDRCRRFVQHVQPACRRGRSPSRLRAPGFEGARITELYLQAGQPFRLPIALNASAEIVVTASRLQGAIETSMGPITALSREDIEGVASVSRDIRDIARRDAFVTIDASNSRTIEVAGQNGRLNRFSVDGMQMSDDFGINNGGLPTSRGPVPYDAIEQLSVKVAPMTSPKAISRAARSTSCCVRAATASPVRASSPIPATG